MVRCDSAWFEHYRHGQAILLRAQIPPKDWKAEGGEDEPAVGRAERVDARLETRPSRLRYEVRQIGEAPAGTVVTDGAADALSTTASGAAQSKGGLYRARRSPTASHRAQRTPSYPPRTNAARADDAAHRALDIDEEPSRMARPTVRALATRLFTAPHCERSHAVPAAPRISAPIPLNCGHPGVKLKRGRAEEVDPAAAAPPTKRRAKKILKPARSTRRPAHIWQSRVSRLDVTSESSQKTCAP